MRLAMLPAAVLAFGALAPAPGHAQGGSGGWTTLFDGTSLRGWRAYGSTAEPKGWRVVDGTLAKDGPADDLVAPGEYGDFEWELEWKIAAGGNAGLFYRGTEREKKVWMTAPEYQLLDDAGHPDGRSRLTSAGAAYGLYPSPEGHLKPVGEWNQARIVVRGAQVEHWLNGTKLLAYTLGSPEWEAKVKGSKFVEFPGYGRAARGLLGIQGDHTGSLAIRHVRVKVLP